MEEKQKKFKSRKEIKKKMKIAAALALLAGIALAGEKEAAAIVQVATNMIGQYPYSWGGGDDNGPTTGIVMDQDPWCDDTSTVGFDCSGLAKYAVFQGTGISMYHYAQYQYDNAPVKVSVDERQPGDLLFYGSSESNIWHVAIYVGNDELVEAPGHNDDCSGMLVQKRGWRTSNLIGTVGRYW